MKQQLDGKIFITTSEIEKLNTCPYYNSQKNLKGPNCFS